jgi:hypothetical protein
MLVGQLTPPAIVTFMIEDDVNMLAPRLLVLFQGLQQGVAEMSTGMPGRL